MNNLFLKFSVRGWSTSARFQDKPFVYFSAADGLRAVFRDLPNRQLAIALFYYQLSLRRSWVNIIHRLPIADWHEVKHIVRDEVIESFQVCISLLPFWASLSAGWLLFLNSGVFKDRFLISWEHTINIRTTDYSSTHMFAYRCSQISKTALIIALWCHSLNILRKK